MSIIMDILASSDRSKELAALSDQALALRLVKEVWAEEPMFTVRSDLIDEAVYRLLRGKVLGFGGNAPERTRPSSAAPDAIRAGDAADMSRSTAASLPSSNNSSTGQEPA